MFPNLKGQVSEWFKEVVLKTTDGVSYPGVRIPPCPFLKLQSETLIKSVKFNSNLKTSCFKIYKSFNKTV